MKKAPYRIVDIPYKTQKRHFSTETVIFGQKKAPAASRRPRKMVLFLEKRYLGQKKSACGKLPTEENGLVPEDRRPDKNSNKNQGKRGGVPMIWPFYDQNRMKIVSSALTFRDGSF